MWAPTCIYPVDAEERLKEAFFRDTKNGFFVEVGANDPCRMSQTWPLEQQGWTGILVEPQPDLAAALRARRRAKVFEAACVAPAQAGQTLMLHLSGSNSSLHPELRVSTELPTGTIPVLGRTLDSILEEADAPSPIDFVSIDVEGFEVSVLKGFSIEYWCPRLLLIEDLALNLSLHRHLRSRGYKWVRRSGLNGWYVPQSSPIDVSWFGHWQFARKHVLSLPFRHTREFKRRIRTRWRAKREATRTV